MYKNIKLSGKLILFSILVSLLPLTITFLTSYASVNKILNNDVYQLIKDKANSRVKEFNQWVIGKKDEVNAMANIPLLRRGTSEEERTAYTAYNLYRMEKNHKGLYDAQWSTDCEGNFIYAEPDQNGNVEKVNKGSIKNRDYWNELASGKVIVSNPLISMSTGKTAVVIASPITSYDGKFIGSVGDNISIESIKESLKNINISEHSFAVLTAQNGVFIAHPDNKFIINKNLNSEKDILSQTILSLKNEKDGTLKEIVYNGRKKLVSNYSIEEAGWTLTIVADYDELFREKSSLIKVNAAIMLVVLIAVIFVSTIIIRSIKTPVKILEDNLLRASNGDLTCQIDIRTKDELGHLANSFNNMIINIRSLVEKVRISSDSVFLSSDLLLRITNETKNSANGVSSAIEDIVLTTDKNAKDIELSSEKAGNLSNSIQQVSSHISSIVDIFSYVEDLNKKGLEVIKLLDNSSKRTKNASGEMNETIISVDRSSQQISAIVEAIGGIASQTNLLALNASIEAARAGEAGKGFAVVADEIRKLAEQTEHATDQIEYIIEDIQKKSKKSVASMNSARKVLEDQFSAVGKTEDIFNDISCKVKEITEKLEHIKNCNKDMVCKKNEIVCVIENIATASVEISSSTEEILASSEEQVASMEEVSLETEKLKKYAKGLQGEIEKFSI